MNPNYLFRGKHVHAMSANEHLDGTWMYGYLCNEDYINTGSGEFLVDKNSIGQYTRIMDRRLHKIFEKDLIKLDDCKFVFEVTRLNDRFVGVDLSTKEVIDLSCNKRQIYVIGNRFDMSQKEFEFIAHTTYLHHHPFQKIWEEFKNGKLQKRNRR